MSSQKDVMEAFSYNETNYTDVLQGMSTIKVNNKESGFSSTTGLIYKNLQDKLFNFGQVNIRYGFILETISVLIIISFFSLTSFLYFRK